MTTNVCRNRPFRIGTQVAKGMRSGGESTVEDTIAEALSVKHQPVVVHVHSSLEQISAWPRG